MVQMLKDIQTTDIYPR